MGGGYSAAARALFARMSEQPTPAQKAAYDAFYQATDVAACLALLDSFYVTGINGTDALLDLKARSNATVVGAVEHSAGRGWRTDGSTGSLAFAATHNALTYLAQNSTTVGAYVCEVLTSTAAAQNLIGLASAATDRLRLTANNAGSAVGRANDASTLSGTNSGLVPGLWTINRSGAAAREIRRGSSVIASDTQASASLIAQAIVGFRNGSAYTEKHTYVGALFFGANLTASQTGNLQAALSDLFAALTPVSTATGVSSLTFAATSSIPDAQGSTAGKVFTCTGLDRLPNDNWIVANFGAASDQSPTPTDPSIVILSPDFSTIVSEFDLSAVTTALGPQGVAYNPVDDVIGWVGAGDAFIRTINPTTGAQVGSIAIDVSANGLAWDSLRGCWIAGRGSNQAAPDAVSWYSTAGVLQMWIRVANNADQFWFDASKGTQGHLWMQYGSNGADGLVDVLDVASRTIVQTMTLTGALSPEGIYRDGADLWVANDGFHHGTAATNTVRRYTVA